MLPLPPRRVFCCCPFLLDQGGRSTFSSVLTATPTSAPPVQVCSLVDHIRSFQQTPRRFMRSALRPPPPQTSVCSRSCQKTCQPEKQASFLFDSLLSVHLPSAEELLLARLTTYPRRGCVPEVSFLVLFSRNKLKNSLTKFPSCLKPSCVFRAGQDAEP